MPSGTHDAVHDPRNETVLIWKNGTLVPRSKATVSVFDSGYLVGDGIWEGLRLHDGVLVFLELHLERLLSGLRTVGISAPYLNRDALRTTLYDTVRANGMFDGAHVRLMITRGVKKTPSQDPRLTLGEPNVVVIAEHKQANPTTRERGISLHTSSVRRPPPSTLDQRLNCHSKLHEVIALNEALAAGADEALMLDTNGHVATCNATNFFAVIDGEVWTSTGLHSLPGITRSVVLGVTREHGLAAREIDFGRDRLESATEAFVTGTFGGITPVRRIDETSLGVNGPVTTRLQDAYSAAIGEYVSNSRHRV